MLASFIHRSISHRPSNFAVVLLLLGCGAEKCGHTCTQCASGRYQDQTGQQSCKACPDGYWTLGKVGACACTPLLVCKQDHALCNVCPVSEVRNTCCNDFIGGHEQCRECIAFRVQMLGLNNSVCLPEAYPLARDIFGGAQSSAPRSRRRLFDATVLCTNGVQDNWETAVDCGGMLCAGSGYRCRSPVTVRSPMLSGST